MPNPTPYPEINHLLAELLMNAQAVLGSHFVGMYLDGSLAGGDFDGDSDIDFVVVTDEEVSDEQFAALQAMHDRLAELDTPWAIQLEGFYLSQQALRQNDLRGDLVPNIERGLGERLKLVRLEPWFEVHRAILGEMGITLVGPAPQTLVAPVSPARLREAMQFVLSAWAAPFLTNLGPMKGRGYQSYIVLSLCRILYTLDKGQVTSKRAAARWAQETLPERWSKLIKSAWDGRHHSDGASSPAEVEETQEFIKYTLESSRAF